MALVLSIEDKNMLQQLEERLWLETSRFDISFLEKILADDFFEIGRSGRVYSRQETLETPREPIGAVIPLPDFKVRLLSDDIAQVTYNSHVTSNGTLKKGRRNSIWQRTQMGWVLKFHQGTPYDDVA